MSAAAFAVIAVLAGGVAAASAAAARMRLVQRARRRKRALGGGGADSGKRRGGPSAGLRYAEWLTSRLYSGQSLPLSPAVRAGRAAQTRAGSWFQDQMRYAGCAKRVSVGGFCEARFRLACAGALAGALFGAVFSTELGAVLGLAGAAFGGSLPKRAVAQAKRVRKASAERHLSEMLEVVGLGLRSGLTFDRSFSLYGSHFENDFARSCEKAHRSWSLGLVTRDEALRDLAASYDCDQLSHVVESIVRSLRFGSALADVLADSAAQARAAYRTALEEKVAKAPIKMMLPTGTLILPAMLLMVMGPILLELAGGF